MNRSSIRKKKAILCGIIAIMFLLTVADIKKEDEPVKSDAIEQVSKEVEVESTVIEQKPLVLPETINVVLTNDNNQQPMRDQFQIKSTSAVTVYAGENIQKYGANTVFSKEMLAGLFQYQESVTIEPADNQSLYLVEADSGKWSAPYRGIFTIYKSDEQYWIVNQLPLEEYLLGVVPGEMPERFSLEALKAQAVCARTYACNMIGGDAYNTYQADVDDSVECQVYNKHGENAKATQAVTETTGVVILQNVNPATEENGYSLADIYYFSTSCGYTTGLEAWGEETVPYLTTVSTLLTPETVTDWDGYLKRTDVTAYDSGSNYFRWRAKVKVPEGCALSIEKREASGIVTQISIGDGNQRDLISTENEVRKKLGLYTIELLDIQGATIAMEQLPSAWFAIEQGSCANEYIIYGGGYGHGIGMSQYGAHGMAEAGMDYRTILAYYFPGTVLNL